MGRRSSGVTKLAGKNAGNCVQIVVETDGAPENIRIGGEVAAPEAIADDDGGREPGRKVLRPKQPPNLGGRPKHGKVVGAGGDHLDTLWLRAAAQIYAAALSAGHVLEYTRPISEVVQFGYGVQNTVQPRPRVIKEDLDQTAGFGKRERAQQHRIHDAENRGVGSNPQG